MMSFPLNPLDDIASKFLSIFFRPTSEEAKALTWFEAFLQKASQTLLDTLATSLAVIATLVLLAFAIIVVVKFVLYFRLGASISLEASDDLAATQASIWSGLSEQRKQFVEMQRWMPQLWLSTQMGKDLRKLVASPRLDGFALNMKVGTAEIKGVEKIVSYFLTKKNHYRLRLIKSDDKVIYSLERDSEILEIGDLVDDTASIQNCVFSVAAKMGARDGRGDPRQENFVRALIYMSKYFAGAHQVANLENAIAELEKSSTMQNLAFESMALSVFCSQLAQTRPHMVIDKVKQLQNLEVKTNAHTRLVLKYQGALAKFYTYGSAEIDEAVSLFNSIKRPCWFVTLLAWVGVTKYQQKVLLYLLAQSNLALCYAHMRPEADETKTHGGENRSDLQKKLKDVLSQLENALTWKCSARLGTAKTEVRWRMLNAEAASTYNWKEKDVNKVVAAQVKAKKAYDLVGYCLDPLANRATLLLHESTLHNEPFRVSQALDEAERIFQTLSETGWDPGYVNYRLAQVLRGRGEFAAASAKLALASDPDVKVMSNDTLDRERRHIEDEVTKISLGNI
ncbi:hypothetical protein GS636_06870 [Ruegeria sp. HKCCD4884]|uniref:hypothetical protein n=1 Tax=Ruegeria sp. HKCCD4884 TaxID=2683022 RepID=UPI00149264C8|nr:hypothetical protein [Ruegeria sp. HKCCD4884]NOD92503.1 hypothetical protein [Ruegeria sp. HKCCD4884]